MKKTALSNNVKKFLVLGFAVIYMSMACACGRNNGENNTNPSTAPSESGTSSDAGAGSTNNNNTTNNTRNTTGKTTNTPNSGRITDKGGANPSDNVSLWDDAGSAANRLIDDAVDGADTLANDILGTGNSSRTRTNR